MSEYLRALEAVLEAGQEVLNSRQGGVAPGCLVRLEKAIEAADAAGCREAKGATCPKCDGSGVRGYSPCSRCGGSGEVAPC